MMKSIRLWSPLTALEKLFMKSKSKSQSAKNVLIADFSMSILCDHKNVACISIQISVNNDGSKMVNVNIVINVNNERAVLLTFVAFPDSFVGLIQRFHRFKHKEKDQMLTLSYNYPKDQVCKTFWLNFCTQKIRLKLL